jgi:hypothetical protein
LSQTQRQKLRKAKAAAEEGLSSQFQRVINLSKGGARLTNELTEEIMTAIRSHPGPNRVYVSSVNSSYLVVWYSLATPI